MNKKHKKIKHVKQVKQGTKQEKQTYSQWVPGTRRYCETVAVELVDRSATVARSRFMFLLSQYMKYMSVCVCLLFVYSTNFREDRTSPFLQRISEWRAFHLAFLQFRFDVVKDHHIDDGLLFSLLVPPSFWEA